MFGEIDVEQPISADGRVIQRHASPITPRSGTPQHSQRVPSPSSSSATNALPYPPAPRTSTSRGSSPMIPRPSHPQATTTPIAAGNAVYRSPSSGAVASVLRRESNSPLIVQRMAGLINRTQTSPSSSLRFQSALSQSIAEVSRSQLGDSGVDHAPTSRRAKKTSTRGGAATGGGGDLDPLISLYEHMGVNEDALFKKYVESVTRADKTLRVNWKSLFAELFQADNAEILETFRSCKEVKLGKAATSAGGAKHDQSEREIKRTIFEEFVPITIEPGASGGGGGAAAVAFVELDQLNKEEQRRRKKKVNRAINSVWTKKVEKKLRVIVTSALNQSNGDNIANFMRAAESVLLYFINTSTAPSLALIPADFVELLVEDRELTIENKLHADGRVQAISLIIPLKESSFHRLLLHALCQFYELHSKSVQAGEAKSVVVSQYLSSSVSAVAQCNVSLVGFLIGKGSTDSSLIPLPEDE